MGKANRIIGKNIWPPNSVDPKQKGSEEHTRQSEENDRLSSFAELNPNPIVETRYTGEILYANKIARRMFPDLCDRGFSHPFLSDIPSKLPVSEQSKSTKESFTYESQIGTSWYSYTIFPEVKEQKVRVFAQDISKIKFAAEELNSQQKFLRQIIDLNPNYIFAKDLDGRYLLVNNAVARRYNLRVEEVLGKTDFDLPQPYEDAARFRSEDLRVIQSEKPLFIPEDPVEINGKIVWLQCEKLPIFDENKQVTQVLGVATDISDRKISEDTRIKLEHRVQHAQKLESLGILAGGIAHDFNNLLMGILGNAGLALMQQVPESPSAKRIEKIKIAAERAAELTNQLLAYSGKGKFIVEPVDLRALVREMTSLLDTVVSKKITLSLKESDDSPIVEADVTQIRQVIMNLITNASEALEDKVGTITITTGIQHVDKKDLSSMYFHDELSPGRFAFIEVKDNGIGMDKDSLAKIFDPFYTTKFTGRGLGLAGVLGIVRSHRGGLYVHSELGRGTVFRALFPTSENKPETTTTTHVNSRNSCSTASKGTVLVVDDEDLILSVATETLELAGYSVLTARNGKEGIERFQAHHDFLVAVLLDITMPIVGGEEALYAMRKFNPQVPIIMSSGYSEQEVLTRIQDAQVSGFLQKPYLPEKLLDKIEGLARTGQKIINKGE